MGLVSALGYSDSQFGLQAARHLVPDGRVPAAHEQRGGTSDVGIETYINSAFDAPQKGHGPRPSTAHVKREE